MTKTEQTHLLFPAQAGMILSADALIKMIQAFPRASGDDPIMGDYAANTQPFSPRKRG